MGIIATHIQRLKNFLEFAQNYFEKKNPFIAILVSIQETLRDFFTFKKKMDMAKYRLNYQRYKLSQMQSLIAENNEHVFLKGRSINEVR